MCRPSAGSKAPTCTFSRRTRRSQDVERELGRRVDGRLRLQQALQPLLDAFDFILIDTPPTLGFWTQAPLVASTDLLIPVDVGYFALEGMRQLLDAIARLRQEVPLTLKTPHILLTKFDARTTLSAHVRALLRESYGAEALHTVIRVNVALARAQMARQSIFAYDRTSTRGPGLSARGGGVTRDQESRGVQRHRDPVPAPEEGTRWPQEPRSGRAAHADSR